MDIDSRIKRGGGEGGAEERAEDWGVDSFVVGQCGSFSVSRSGNPGKLRYD